MPYHDWRDTLSENADLNEIGRVLHDRLYHDEPLSPFEAMYNPQTTTGKTGRWGKIFQVWPPHGRTGFPKALKLVRSDLKPGDVLPAKIVWESECRAARKICDSGIDSPNIVKYYDIPSEMDYQCWLTMEWVEGNTIAEEYLAGELDIFTTISMVATIATAVKELKDNGVRYLDIHPGNIIVRNQLIPTLIDPAACIPLNCPPEWSGLSIPDILCLSSAEVEAGQVFLIANLMLDMIFRRIPGEMLPGEPLEEFAAGHFEANDFEGETVLKQLTDKMKVYLESHHGARDRIPENHLQVFAKQLSECLYYSVSGNTSDRPSTLDSFKKMLLELVKQNGLV